MGRMLETLRTLTSILFFALSVRTLWVQIIGASSAEWAQFFNALRESAPARVLFVNYVAGTLFTALYVASRDAPRFLFVPPLILSVIGVLAGTWLPLLFVSSLLAKSEGLNALVPARLHYAGARRGVTVAVGAVFAVVAVTFGVVAVMAVNGKGGLGGAVGQSVAESSLALLCFAVVFVIVRESSFLKAVPWVALLLVVGNSGACVYGIAIAVRAFREDLPFHAVFLAPADARVESEIGGNVVEEVVTGYEAI